jgi:hypothetical protein
MILVVKIYVVVVITRERQLIEAHENTQVKSLDHLATTVL